MTTTATEPAILDYLAANTQSGTIYAILKNTSKHLPLKYFFNFKNEKVFFVGSDKNKIIFRNIEDCNKIKSYLKS